jgi:xylulokinase
LLAGVGAKFWASVDEACDAVIKVQQRVRPDPNALKALALQYQNFRRLYPALKPLFAQMNSGA